MVKKKMFEFKKWDLKNCGSPQKTRRGAGTVPDGAYSERVGETARLGPREGGDLWTMYVNQPLRQALWPKSWNR